MKIIILGSKGMLGTELGRVFYDQKPYLLDKDELDITNRGGVVALFKTLKPTLVINAAAYTDVDGCEDNRDLAVQINGEAPGYLAEASNLSGAVFVHYSTDYVFSGDKKEGYSEDDEPENPVNFYGESKLMGEEAILSNTDKFYIIRTSWLFGLNGKNFVEIILSKAKEEKELRVVNDQYGKPTYALDLARETRRLLEGEKDFGFYHITNEPYVTWYEFAKAILRIGESKARITPCSSDEFLRKAKRPKYSILNNSKLDSCRNWTESLREYMLSRKK